MGGGLEVSAVKWVDGWQLVLRNGWRVGRWCSEMGGRLAVSVVIWWRVAISVEINKVD